MGKIARHIREKVMKLKRMIVGQRQKFSTNTETHTREIERQKRNSNGRAKSKGTSWREVKNIAEQLLIRSQPN